MAEIKRPKVSILIPVFNRKNYISECIQSALDQTFMDFEAVVVDNASDDGTWEICQQFSVKDHRVRAFRNDTNVGPVRNWLACVAQARGEYTKILWSDDLLAPEFLSKLLPYLDDPSVGFVYSSANVFNKVKEVVFAKLNNNTETGIYDSKEYIEGALLGGEFPYSPGCAIFRTEDVKRNLLLQVPNRVNSDSSMHAIGNDLLLFLLTARTYPKFAVVNESLAYFRAHQNSITISAPKGKIPLHYDLAKGFFAENYVLDVVLLKRLNTQLFIHLLRFNANEFGITSLDDFYPTAGAKKIDWVFLARILMRRLRKWLASLPR